MMNTDRGGEQRRPRSWRRWTALGLGVLLLVAAAVAAVQLMPGGEGPNIASFEAQRGDFVISLVAKKGEMEAAQADQVVAPRVRGELKIVTLWPEGEKVDVGDVIVQFDQTEFKKRVTDAEERLEVAEAEMEKSLANQAAQISRLKADIEDKGASLRLAELNLEKMKYEAQVTIEQEKLNVKRAEISLNQAGEKLKTQRIVDAADSTKLALDIAQRQRDLDKANKDFESLSMKAEKPGMVVYEKVWKGGRREKVRVGDTPWGGQSLIDLPDLSVMEVKTEVNEVDVDKIKVGQRVLVKLDALPEPTFHGEITEIAKLAREKEEEHNIKVFDVTVQIEERDERLKPGMSAKSEIIIETIPDVVYVPLESVFEKDGKTMIYRVEDGVPVASEVVVGKKNENYVVVEEGISGDDRITLRDPTLTLEDVGGEMPGEGGGEGAKKSVSVGG